MKTKTVINLVVAFIVTTIIFATFVQVSWNYGLASIFEGVRTISFIEAFFLKLLSDCLFKNIKFPKNERK
tara:strand:+ start:528 stop:737 length:210 start_codon:yes stop_codon:yes gene_type:complete